MWDDIDPVELEPEIELPQFDLIASDTMKCEMQQYKTGRQISNFFIIEMHFRAKGAYINYGGDGSIH